MLFIRYSLYRDWDSLSHTLKPSTLQGIAKPTAKQAASELVYGKEVTLQIHGKDKYKRTLANLILSDGISVNQQLVKAGACWWYRKYAPGDTVLEGLEKEAREARKGLWADPKPIPPWEWRKRTR